MIRGAARREVGLCVLLDDDDDDDDDDHNECDENNGGEVECNLLISPSL